MTLARELSPFSVQWVYQGVPPCPVPDPLPLTVQREQALQAEQERALLRGRAGRRRLHSREEIRNDANGVANGCARALALVGATRPERAVDELRKRCDVHGIEYPASKWGVFPEVARLVSPEWWGRKLRKGDVRGFEAEEIAAGRVSRYCSTELVRHRKNAKAEILHMLAGIVAVNESGEWFTLEDLASRSVANPALRRAELMVRLRGCDEICAARKWSWTMITLTCPSRFHRMRTRRDKDGAKVLVPNPAWQAERLTPRDGQDYLCLIWSRIRAELDRLGVLRFGFRMAEPHKDGTPHWHVIVYAHPSDLDHVERVCREYGLADSPDEAGAQERRVNVSRYDAAKDKGGGAAAYAAKYVSKNIDGAKQGGGTFAVTDHDGELETTGGKIDWAADSAARVEAWASCWGIRQFQPFGQPSVTCWRELRRVREVQGGAIEPARAAADKKGGHWAEFCNEAERVQLSLFSETSADLIKKDASGSVILAMATAGDWKAREMLRASPHVNKWGEPTRRFIRGVVAKACGEFLLTRVRVWFTAAMATLLRLDAQRIEGEPVVGLQVCKDVLMAATCDAAQRARLPWLFSGAPPSAALGLV